MATFKQQLKRSTIDSVLGIFKGRKMLVMFLLGYSSGLPLMITASSLLLWYREYGVSIQNIGLLSLVGVPYVFKYLWSPLVDRYNFKWLGHRRSWIFLMQIAILCGVLLLAQFNPDQQPLLIAGIALAIAFCSATQDIAINAYQVEILKEEERAIGNAVSVLGYRVGMLVTGGGLLILVEAFGNDWHKAFLCVAPFVLIGMVGTFIAKEHEISHQPRTLYEAVVLPFLEFIKRGGLIRAGVILAILIFYKLGDQIAFSLNTVFFRDLGFSLDMIATAFKVNGMISSMIGIIVGGLVATRFGIYRSFLLFSVCMACANLMYLWLAMVGYNVPLMFVSVVVEYFIGAMGTAVLLAMEMSLVNVRFSATQFAVLSSIDSLGRVFVGPMAGYIQTKGGWETLFFTSFLVGVVISVVIFFARKPLMSMANLKA